MIRAEAMGIIFPNAHDTNIPEITGHRTMASVPFAGRYRMIDFCLSGMAGAGITNIGVVLSHNYQSLMDHLGSGREWDLSRKRGGLIVFPPYGRGKGQPFGGRIEALGMVLEYLQDKKERLVVMSDCDIACNLDYKKLIQQHSDSDADITAVYQRGHIHEGMLKDNTTFTFDDDGFTTEIRSNDYRKGLQNLSMGVFVIGRELLIDLVKDAVVRGENYFERDTLARNLKILKMRGHKIEQYSARIYDMQSYFDENLRLLEDDNLQLLFPEDRPVYTKVRDEAPVRYAISSAVNHSLVADGCIVEGSVDNCVLFRSVRIGKNARLKNCVIMQGSVVEDGAVLENVVTDKNVLVKAGQQLRGSRRFPVFVSKGSVVE